MFEVPSLKLLAAHSLVRMTDSSKFPVGNIFIQDSAATTENRTDEAIHSHYGTNSSVMATMIQAGEEVQHKLSATSSHEKLGHLLYHTPHRYLTCQLSG